MAGPSRAMAPSRYAFPRPAGVLRLPRRRHSATSASTARTMTAPGFVPSSIARAATFLNRALDRRTRARQAAGIAARVVNGY
jgi:hypothetical protein